MRVLFVDDDKSVRDLLSAFCDSLGVEYRTVHAAEAALDICEKEPFALCVTDLRMPGMDGVRLAKELRGRYPEMVLFAFTGESGVYPLADVEEAFDRVYLKPSDYSRLIAESMKQLALKKYPFLR